MTNNLKIEVLVSNIPEDGSIASQFPSQEYVKQQLAKKANLSPEGRLDPAQAPDYTEIPGLYEHIEDTKDAIETSIADSLQDAKGYTNQQLSTSLRTKADLVNGKIPFDQIPFSADIEDQIQINVENITAVVDQKVAQVVEQVNGVATAANRYTDTKVAENKTYVDTTVGNVIEDVERFGVSKAVTIPTYLTPEAGVAAGTGVAAGAYYNVSSTEDDTMLVEYQNVGGVPTPSGKSYPSSVAVQALSDHVDSVAEYTALPYSAGKPYKPNERVQLSSGEIVVSINDDNTNDPNTDMLGWELWLSAGRVKLSNGSSVQKFFDSQQVHNEMFITPEMYGAKANDPAFDNTSALNNAFATGKDVYSMPDKTYYVNGSLRTKGQKLIGGWKIHSKKATSRKGIWEQEVTVNNDGLDTSNNIRMMYVSSSWDLSEFLAIKELGYNMIHHYVGMSVMGWDWDGNVQDVLNNAMCAGLKVSLGIEQDPAAKADLSAWVKSVDHYPALWAYSVIDEPVSRGFTVADQDAKIAQMRALTKKTLFTVDWVNNAFEQKYSKNYDMVLVNSYSMKYATDASTWFQEDLKKFRLDFGVIKSQVGTNARVIPCVSMFTFTNSANFFSADVDQIVRSSEYFAKVSNGDYVAFVWDGEADAQITGSVRDTRKFQDLSVQLSKQPRLQLKTDVIKFGGFNNIQTDWGISELLPIAMQKDSQSDDTFIGVNSYPVILKNGVAETDRSTAAMAAGAQLSGLAFKKNVGRFVTTLPSLKRLRVYLEAFSPTMILNGAFSVDTTRDGGYSSTNRFNSGVNGNQVLNYDITLDESFGNIVLQMEDSGNPTNYRIFLRGVIISSDW